MGRRQSARRHRASYVRVAPGRGAATPFARRAARDRRRADEGKLPIDCPANRRRVAGSALRTRRPGAADLPNQALNHASSAMEGAAAIAVAATATIPQLGFIHEDPGQSFVLDIADLYRDTVTIPCAFRAAKRVNEQPAENVERVTRRLTGRELARERIIPAMIERIKSLFAEGADEG